MSAKILQNDKVDKKTDRFRDSVTLSNMASIEFVRITGCDISNKGTLRNVTKFTLPQNFRLHS